MGEIPGKACGECSFCCKVLEIVEFEKPAGRWCEHCQKSGGCGVYETRPAVCRAYECLWKGDRALGAQLRPDRVGVILMEDPDSDEYRAVCDPAKPWPGATLLVFRHPLADKHWVQRAGGRKDRHRLFSGHNEFYMASRHGRGE